MKERSLKERMLTDREVCGETMSGKKVTLLDVAQACGLLSKLIESESKFNACRTLGRT